MKKIFITIFSLILISGLTINASACGTCGCQKDAKKECSGNIESSSEDKTTKSCSKSKKECCKSKNNSSSSKSSKKGSFNFDKSNDYAKGKSSCSKSAKKSCCKKKEVSTDSNEKKDVQIEEAN